MPILESDLIISGEGVLIENGDFVIQNAIEQNIAFIFILEKGTNRINAGLDVTLNIKIKDMKKPLGGSIDILGGVKYSQNDGSFFLKDPQLFCHPFALILQLLFSDLLFSSIS